MEQVIGRLEVDLVFDRLTQQLRLTPPATYLRAVEHRTGEVEIPPCANIGRDRHPSHALKAGPLRQPPPRTRNARECCLDAPPGLGNRVGGVKVAVLFRRILVDESHERPQDFLVAERHDVTFDAGLVRNRPCIHAEVAPVRCAGFGKTAKPALHELRKERAPGAVVVTLVWTEQPQVELLALRAEIRAERAQRGLLVRESLRVTLVQGAESEADRRPKHSLKMRPVRPDIICDSIEQRERCQDSGALLLRADTRPRRAEGIGPQTEEGPMRGGAKLGEESARVIQTAQERPVVDLSDERKIPASVGLETPEHRLTPEHVARCVVQGVADEPLDKLARLVARRRPPLADEPAQHERGYAAEHLRLRVDSQHRALDLPAGAIELRRKAFDDRRDGNARAGVNDSAGEHDAVRREADLTTGSEFGEQRARDGRERARPIGAKPDENWLCRMNGHEDLRQSWVMRLRKAAARALAQGPRLAILAVCALEWRVAIADTVVETHDRIVGRTWREAERQSALRVAEAHKDLGATLSAFQGLGSALIEAKEDGVALEDAVAASCGWSALEQLVAVAVQLTDTVKSDPLAHVVQGYRRLRRYAPRMLRTLDMACASVAEPLVAALSVIGNGAGTPARPMTFLRPRSKWRPRLNTCAAGDSRLWQVAVLFHMRDAFVRAIYGLRIRVATAT